VSALALLVYAALHDLAARTIPNWLPLCVLLVGAMLRVADHSLLPALAVAGTTFAVLFVIWVAGAIGGGDVKFWAATALLIPPRLQPELAFFLHVFMIGGLLALLYLGLWLVMRRQRPAPVTRAAGLATRVLRAEAWRIARRGPLPYALAISASAIITLSPLSLSH
jgi:prepilin peptidase CpaA